MKTKLLFLWCLLSISISQAQTFNDGVFEYTVTSGTNVSIDRYNSNCPTGLLTIPSTVIDTGTTYNVTSIASAAFQNCTSITSVIIPDSIITVDTFAFDNCSNLTSATLSNSLTSIGYAVFSYCSNLTSITIPNSVTNIPDYAFQNCTSLTSITIPNSVTNIGDVAFGYCTALTNITIPNSVTSIGNYAFYGSTGLTSIDIPNSVTNIGIKAFYGCTGLTNVTVHWATPLVISWDTFQNVTVSAISLTVPAGTVALYQAANFWQDFGSFVLSTENFSENNIDLQLFPNPVKEILNIKMDDNLSQAFIYNLQGQKVIESTTKQINVSNLKNGVYFIKVSAEGKNSTKRFIKR